MCCTRLAGNTGRKNYAKNSPSGHHRTNLSGCIFATKACRPIEVGKNLLNSSISSTCLHNMANFGPLTAEIGLPVWGTPAVTAATSLTGCQPNIAQCLAVSIRLYTIYTFSGALARDGILPDAKFTLHPSLAFSYTGSVILHGTPVAGVSQILRRGTRNGITELTQRAPPIFGWAAITLADILVMATLCNRAGHYIFALWFLSYGRPME